MNFLTSVRLFLGDTAAVILAFALGVLFCPSIQNLLATVTSLTARLAARFAPTAASAATATAPPAPAAGAQPMPTKSA
jgi:hypothetical protein